MPRLTSSRTVVSLTKTRRNKFNIVGSLKFKLLYVSTFFLAQHILVTLNDYRYALSGAARPYEALKIYKALHR